ncbi:MAG TPA: hypothetical protein ENN25_04740 [Euryarchaeota archaeon]|nr:hypothetical protein [Euryarchaeota archaeon]
MLDMKRVLALGRRARGPVGIGMRTRSDAVRMSISEAADRGLPEIVVYENSKSLCSDLSKGEISSAVRGTLSSTELLPSIKEEFGISTILRVALLVTAGGKPFFLAPVGIDEGNNLDERTELLRQGVRFLKCLGVRPKIAVLSKGRAEDARRGEDISKSLDEGDILTQRARAMDLEAEHRYILIEQAVEAADFLIAPDGVSGNLIFRSLYFLGKGDAVGAPIVNIPAIFVDTSRDKRSYHDALALAAGLEAAREDMRRGDKS